MTFFPVKDFQDLSAPGATNEATILGAVLSAMCLAMATSTNTSGAVTTVGATVSNVEAVIKQLRDLGYGVSTGTNTLTVTW